MKHRPWRICFLPQLPHLQGKDEHHYEQFRQAKEWAFKQLKDWEPWCKRYNSAGLVVLDELRTMVAETEGFFWQNPEKSERIIEGVLDQHTGTKVRCRIRKVSE